MYFPGNSPLLKFFFSILSNFSCCLTSVLILPSNSATAFLAFSKSFSFSQVSFSVVNLFHCTRYFTTPLIFLLLFKIFSTFHSSTPSISTSFTFSTFCLSYLFSIYTSQLTFTTGYILIEVGNHSLIVLVETTFILNITLSLFFQFLTLFFPLSACLFIFS